MINIKPYEKNAKKHPDKHLEQIARSIKEFGWRQPIVVDGEGVIVVGHGRWFAYQKHKDEMQLPEPWIVTVTDLTPDQIRAYRLADNKLNESDWDNDILLEELGQLDLKGFDISLTGFGRDFLMGLKEDDFDAQKEYDSITQPEAKVGDIYQLGRHRLVCGDSTKRESFEKLMDGKLARLIFTDPPYNVDYKSPGGLSYNSTKFGGTGGKIFNDDKSDEDCLEFYTQTLKNLSEFSTDDATLYWWFANKNNAINRQAFAGAKWHMSQIIIWLKNSPVFSMGQDYHRCYEPCMLGWKKGKAHYTNKKITNFRDVFGLDAESFEEQLDIWYQKRDATQNYVHPTQKPVRLAERALKKNSEPGDIVVDVFGGSGSTLISCEQSGRVGYLLELDPKYVDVIIKRYQNYAGGTVTKIN